MESLFVTIKFVLFLSIEVFVVATVGAMLIAGLYQLIQTQVHSTLNKVRKSRTLIPTAVRKSR